METAAEYQARRHREARERIARGDAEQAERLKLLVAAAKPKRPLRPIRHGTRYGARAHARRGEPACLECLDARQEYDRLSVRKHRGLPLDTPKGRHVTIEAEKAEADRMDCCGVLKEPAGDPSSKYYERHRRVGTEPCLPARAELNAYRQATRPSRRTTELRPCGTVAAYRRHLRHGEVPCRPCKDAANLAVRRYNGFDGADRRNPSNRQEPVVKIIELVDGGYEVVRA